MRELYYSIVFVFYINILRIWNSINGFIQGRWI
jgi:hypothetical protein